jgi:hypothetical protein
VLGRDYPLFWELTPGEVVRILNADAKRRTRDADDLRGALYEMAGLVAYAFHEPRRMPKFAPLGVAAKPAGRTDEAAQAMLREYLRGIAKRGKR